LLAFLTREPSTNHQSQAGFLTCASPKEPFPSKKNSGTTPFGLLNYIRTDAYSGATATDFHRVPFYISDLKGQTCNQIFSFPKNKRKIPKQKIKATEKKKNFTPTPIYIVAAKLKNHSRWFLSGFQNAQLPCK